MSVDNGGAVADRAMVAEWQRERDAADAAEAAEALSVVEDANAGRAAKVIWIDSGQSIHGWRNGEKVLTDLRDGLPEVESVGIWIGETDRVVMLAGSRDKANDNWCECQLIWKPAIIGQMWLS